MTCVKSLIVFCNPFSIKYIEIFQINPVRFPSLVYTSLCSKLCTINIFYQCWSSIAFWYKVRTQSTTLNQIQSRLPAVSRPTLFNPKPLRFLEMKHQVGRTLPRHIFSFSIVHTFQHSALKVNSICRGSYWRSSMWIPMQLVDYCSHILHSSNTWEKMGIQWSSAPAVYRLQESLWFS